MHTKLAVAVVLTLGACLIGGCDDDDDVNDVDRDVQRDGGEGEGEGEDADAGRDADVGEGGAGLLDTVAAAIAPDGVDRIDTQRFAAAGKRFDHLEAYSPTSVRGYEQLVYTSHVAVDLEHEAHHGAWDSTTVEVFPGTRRNWTETAAGGLGYAAGEDGGFPPAGEGTPMLSSRVAARWKELRLMTPVFLIQHALAHPGEVEELPDERWQGLPHRVLSIGGFEGWPAPVRLFVDPETYLPAKVDTLEDDPVYGDALVELAYGDWQQAGVSLAPFAVTQYLAGSVILDEQRSEVADNPALPGGELEVPTDLQGTVNPELAALGARSSEYLLRTQEYGFAGYDDVSRYMQPVELGNGLIYYQFAGYNSLAVELESSLLVVEAPLYESVSAAEIEDLEQRFPNKPIQYLVSTHFHYDHSGGVRAYAAVGAQIIVPFETADFYRTMLEAPHTLRPDALAQSPQDVTVTPVGDFLSISEGARTVTLFNIRQSHSEGALVAFVEDAGVMFASDLYNPGMLGPNPTGPDRPFHDLYARELVRGLTDLGLGLDTITTFLGGHGMTGTWEELRVFGGLSP